MKIDKEELEWEEMCGWAGSGIKKKEKIWIELMIINKGNYRFILDLDKAENFLSNLKRNIYRLKRLKLKN